MTHPDATNLHEYADGTLPAASVPVLEGHLEGCAACREEVGRLRRYLADVARLPRSIEPGRDLWTDIQSNLVVRRKRDPTHPWTRRVALLAAAVVLVVMSSVITRMVVQPRAPTPAMGLDRGPEMLVRFQQTEREYARAIAELEEVLEVARSRLAPETVVLIERNLAVIDAAIDEARMTIARDSAGVEVLVMLTQRYEDKLELLRRVTRLATQS